MTSMSDNVQCVARLGAKEGPGGSGHGVGLADHLRITIYLVLSPKQIPPPGPIPDLLNFFFSV